MLQAHEQDFHGRLRRGELCHENVRWLESFLRREVRDDVAAGRFRRLAHEFSVAAHRRDRERRERAARH